MKKLYFVLALFISISCFGQGSGLVISQVFGGHPGVANFAFKRKYVELFNRSNQPINLSGYALQIRYIATIISYNSWTSKPLPAVTIAPGQYFLIYGPNELLSSSSFLPGDFYIDDTEWMDMDLGSVAITSTTATIPNDNVANNIIDLVTWGNAVFFEGNAPTAAVSDYSKAITRKDNGCQDTDDNFWDFQAIAANPRKMSSPLNVCGYNLYPTIVAGPSVYDLRATVGVASVSGYYSVSGHNLSPASGVIEITAPAQFFEISIDNINFSNGSIQIPYTGSALAPTTVYVRISAITNFSGTYLNENIRHTGGSADINDLPVSGILDRQFYNTKADLGLENPATWSSNPDGTGISPASFDRDYQTFHIIDEAKAHFTGTLRITGNNSRIRVGDGISPMVFTIEEGADSVASATKIDVSNLATLKIKNYRIPVIDSLDVGSTVDYAQSSTLPGQEFFIPKKTYYHLKLTDGLKFFPGGTSTVNGNLIADAVDSLGGSFFSEHTLPQVYVGGDVVFMNGTVFDIPSSGNEEWLGIYLNKPTGTQQFITNGTTVKLFDLRREISGSLDVIFSPDAAIEFRSRYSQYGLALNNSNTRVTTTGGSFSFYNGGMANNNSNFGMVMQTNETSFYFYNNLGYGTLGQLRFAPGSTIKKLLLSTASTNDSIKIANTVTITDSLILYKGNVKMSPGAVLQLSSTAVVWPTAGSPVSFVQGTMQKTGNTPFTFPLGIIRPTRYAPVDITSFSGPADTYTAAYINNGYGNYTIDPTTLSTYPAYNVSRREYWQVTPSLPGSSADLRFYYYSNPSIVQPSLLRMARFDGTDWNDIGGLPDPANNLTSGSVLVQNVAEFNTFSFASEVSGTIPVQLLSFTVSKQQGYAQLNWSTAQEINTKEFIIERSINGSVWMVIGSVLASGNSNTQLQYQYRDGSPSRGINYYRLKPVDRDGKFSYSVICSVNFDISNGWMIAPNPSNGNTVIYLQDAATVTQLFIYDATGKLVKSMQINVGENSIPLKLDMLAKGMYTVKLVGKTKSESRQLIIE